MKQSELKNMVILKNLPSNIVEEAIVILKANKKIKKLEKVEKNKKKEENSIPNKQEDYILKEAEMLVTDYISNFEEKKKTKRVEQLKNNTKYKKLKIYSSIATAALFIETLILLIK